MAQMTKSWNPMTWFKSTQPRKATPKRSLVLEALESREVPAIITVTNLLDSTNPTDPIPGSLREAVERLATSGDEIRFADSLFPEGGGTKTLILNGAVGALQIEQNNITIVGPGRFTTGNNDYKLTIQSDIGFSTVSTAQITNGGIGFNVGDYLDQGSTEFLGGARFQVMAVGASGNITQVSVVNPGANSTFAGTLSGGGTGVSSLTPIGNSTGSGAIFTNPGKGLASSIVVSQLINSTPQNLSISGIHFGNAKATTILQNLGNLTISDSLFDSAATTFISSAVGAGNLTINNSVFDGAGIQVAYGGGGAVTVNNSTFSHASLFGSGAAISGGGTSITINNSGFLDGENGVSTSAGKASINNTYFSNISNGALTLNGSNTTVTNAYFADNTRSDGIQINPSSYAGTGQVGGPNGNKGGAAIFAWNGANLAVSKSLFLRNSVGDPNVAKSGINVFNSGGGAIFNYSGTLSIDQSGFTENSVAITHFPTIEPPDNATDFAANPELMPSPANSGGGALYSGGPTTITNSYFNKNAVYSSVEYWTYTKMPDTPPPPPSLPQYAGGGAMYLTSNNGTSNITISNTTVTENKVEQVNPTANPYVGALVSAITSADFDNDGFGDLAVGSILDSLNIQIRTGTGTGNFANTPDFILSAGSQLSAMTTGDFNGDGFIDLAASSNVTTGSNLSVFLNKGISNGVWQGFNPAVNYTFGSRTTSIVSADLNNDGRGDLVLGNNSGTSNIQVALAGVTGTFTATQYTLGGNTAAVAVGDLNGDNLPDIAAALGTTSNNVRILLSDSKSPGQFAVGPTSTAGAKALTSIGIGQLNNTALNLKDIVVSNADTADNVYTLLDYDGIVFNWAKYTAGDSAKQLVVADYNQDGNDDVAIAQLKDTDNLQVGLSNNTGVLTFNTYTAGTKASSITNVKFQTASKVVNLGVGDQNLNSNIQIARNQGNGTFTIQGGGTIGSTSLGQGLTGGAIVIAAGVDNAVNNTVIERAFTGTTIAQLVNVTITNNSLINPFAITGKTVINSNVRTVQFSGSGYANNTDTGGVFNNTGAGSSITLLNTILTRNIGINYTSGGPSGQFTGKGVIGYTNAGNRYSTGGPGAFTSSGNNLYNSVQGFPSSGAASGDLTASDSAPIFDVNGLQNNLGPVIGLSTAQPVTVLPDQGQGNILTLALDRLSPARDSGNSSVYNTGTPIQLNTDARGVKRLINLAVDMGAYEVQFATQTTIVNPTLTPASPPTYPNPYLLATYGVPLTITALAKWNDNKVPNTVISGTISLVNADDQSIIYATGTITPLSTTDFKLGGTANLVVNTTDLNVLPPGKNNYIAVYSGDTNYAISQSNIFTIDVSPATTTTTLNLGIPDVQSPNSNVTFTGTVNYAPSTQIPTGTVTLQRQPVAGGAWTDFGNGTVSSGQFSIDTTFPALGDFNVRAVFASDDTTHFLGSTSNTVLEQIGYIPSITLQSFPAPVERGTPVSFTAVVTFTPADGDPTGTVTFQTLGGITIATVNPPVPNPAGTMTYVATLDPSMLPLGDNSIIAIYNRDGGSYVTQTSKEEVLTLVGRATTTTLIASPTSGVYGSPVLFTATVSPSGPPAYAGGSINFFAGGTLLQSLPVSFDAQGNPLPVNYTTFGLDSGSLSVTAVYTGDQINYQGSTSNSVNVDISPAATQLTLNPSVSRIEVGQPVTLTATLTNSAEDPAVQPSGNIDFYLDGVKIGSKALSGNVATLVVTPSQVGTFVYEAKYAATNNYQASSASTTVTAFVQTQENFYLVAPQQGSIVQMFDRLTNQQITVFQPFGPGYTGGFTVAKGDVNGDGIADLLYAPRVGGQIQIYDGANYNPIGTIFPFGAGFPMSMSIAVGDINGDGYGDVIAGPSGIGMPPHVIATSGHDMTSILFSQYAYAPQFLGGVSVAAGEVNGNGAADIITAPLVGAPPHIVSFDGKTGAVLQSYYAYSPLYQGGTSITAADLDGDGYTEIVTGASAAAPHVVVVDSRTQTVKASFYAFSPQFGGGVRVTTVQDINGDGVDDIVVAPGPGAGPNIVRFDGKKALQNQAVVLDSFFAYGSGDPSINFFGGTFVG